MSYRSLTHVALATLSRPPLARALTAAIVLMALACPPPLAPARAAAAEATAAEEAPAASEQPAPAAEAAPAAAEEAPVTSAEAAPAAGAEPPAAAGGSAAVTPEQPPATGEQAPSAAEEAPAGAEQAPAGTEQTPEGTEEAPSATAQVPTVRALTPAEIAEGKLTMNFHDASLGSVLDYLSEAAGLIIIPQVPVDGRITITALKPMSLDEAISSLNTALKQNGLAAIRMDSTLKIVTLDTAKTASIPVRTGNNPLLVPQTDEMVTWIIPVRYCDAPRLASDLAALVPAYALLTANASSNSLILTATCADVHRIVEIVHALDTQQAGVAEVRVFRLEYADASAAAALINQIFQQTNQNANQRGGFGGRGGFFFQRGGGGGGNQQNQQQGQQAPPVLAAADTRTNTLVVSGPADTLLIVEGVVKDLDSNPAEEEDVLVYALKNSDATNLTSVLNTLFQQSTQTAGGRTTTGGRTTGGRGGTTFGSRFSTTTNQALAGLTGSVYVVAETDTNSLLIRTAPKNFTLVRTIVQELDRPVPQVLIKVLIAEVTHEDTTDWGTEFSVLNLVTGADGENLMTDFGVAAQSQGLIYKVLHGDTNAILRILETIGKLEVLSRPYILASDNQEATITVGDTVPFIQNTRTTDTGNTINTIQYQDIGIILTVTAHINPDGLVIMDISPEISSISGASVPISETVDAPVFTKRSATSRVAIRDAQTIVIGGLVEDSKTSTIKQVPILGDLPLIGFLFRRSVNDKKKTELLIFLTPHVAHIADDLVGISEGEVCRSQNVAGAVRPGAFQKQMEGMKAGKPAPGEEPCPPSEPAKAPGATVTLPPVAPAVTADP